MNPLRSASRLVLLVLIGIAGGLATTRAESIFTAGDLELIVARTGGGIILQNLRDSSRGQELLAQPVLPLFSFTARTPETSGEVAVRADAGWGGCEIKARTRRLELKWLEHTNPALRGITVHLTGTARPRENGISWALNICNDNSTAAIWRVVFPQVALAEPGTNGVVFFPRGPGEVQQGIWTRPFNYRGTYPDGWCCMQFMAAYAEARSGLYVACQDPWGSTKDLLVRSEPSRKAVHLSFDHPVPDMGRPGAGFVLEGEAVWQLLSGDWFDASMIYRDWARKNARWWPKLGRSGRADTPLWTRQLSAWAMTGGAPGECVGNVRKFRDYLGIPVGFHWYNWHQIPFDNDYPHYFPPKEGFAQGIATLKEAGVFPMPYINGRLWDSHDRGTNDFEFSRVALSAVTKKEDGSPQLETYGSKESNGEPVYLGVMCPATEVWRNTVSNIVIGLLRRHGTSSVYIDQVAAAAPKLCMDASHGHPLGGGHWWTESYWRMLRDIRRAMPSQTMLTTECNAEPFIHVFDEYLTWHWQYDNQVPAFPAVYGGAIQMFGRAYRGGATKDLALRMKAAQQLVFGEQLGWLDPNIVTEPQNADYFRQLARLRESLSKYFYAGRMARPPKLLGDMPRLRADWQWSGEWWVTTDAVLAGAWKSQVDRKIVLIFANASDLPVTATVQPDLRSWQIPEGAVPRFISPGSDAGDLRPRLGRPFTFAPRQAQAWEFDLRGAK